MLTPNLIAYLALLLSPLVALVALAMWRASIAVPAVLLWAQLFLPPKTVIDGPIIPPLDKGMLPSMFLLIGCIIFRRKSLQGSKPLRGYDLLVVFLALASMVTALTNPEPLFWGPTTKLKGMTLHDWVADAIQVSLYWFIPVYLGRSLTKTSEDLKYLLMMIAVAGILYTPFLFIEFRMSPQLNRWIYGYHQSEFQQTVRGSHYRPKVFMAHGLNVAMFMLMSVFAAMGLAQMKERLKWIKARTAAIYLLVVLLFLRSAGVLIFAVVGLTLQFFTRPRSQMRFAAVLATLIFAYPLIRAFDLLPVDDTLDFFASLFGADRAGSLGIRLNNEGNLLAHAMDKIVFGWGGYARNFVYDETTGVLASIVDGTWILLIGSRGMAGWFAVFALMLLPVFRARRMLARMPDRREQMMAGCLTLMVTFFVADQIPNGTVDPYLLYMVGALIGITKRGFLPPEQPAGAMPAQAFPAGARMPA